MMYTRKLAVVSLVSLMACLSEQAALSMGAKHLATPEQFQEFKLIPRVNLWGFAGDYTRGEGQTMIPIWGDAGHALYFLAEGNKVVNDNDWMGGAGFGYRQVFNNRIFGGYLIGSYHNSAENNGFYIANPGLEMLGAVWDINANGYIPFKQKKSFEIIVGPESEIIGDTRNVQFTDHQMTDHRIQEFVGTGGRGFGEEAARGFDVEVGRTIPHVENLRIYLGGYHFDADDVDSVNGVEARAVCEFNRYFALEGEYNYDDVNHSKAVIGLRFTLGGYSAKDQRRYGIATRLLDPIEHDLVVGSSGIAEVEAIHRVVDLGPGVVHDNLWFFRRLSTLPGQGANDIGPGVVQGSGTFEDPYIGFTPENFGNINPNISSNELPLLYFAPGPYNFSGTGPNFQNNRFSLPNGWGMFGRTENYVAAAVGNERATFAGGLDLNYALGAGGAVTTLDSIRVLHNQGISADNIGLFVNNAQNVVLQSVDVQNLATVGEIASFGIIVNSSKLTMNSSNVLATNSAIVTPLFGSNTTAYGISSNNSEVILGTANNILGVSQGFSDADDDPLYEVAWAWGIKADSNSTINIQGNNNSISANATAGDAISDIVGIAVAVAHGLHATTGSIVSISGTGNNISATATGGTATGSSVVFGGARAWGLELNSANFVISAGGNSVTSSADGGTENGNPAAGEANGMSLVNSIANFQNITSASRLAINVEGDPDVWGVLADGNSDIQENGVSTLTLYGTGTLSGGAPAALTNIVNKLVNISRLDSGTGGQKIQWVNAGLQVNGTSIISW